MQKDANLVELEKCCRTHIFLQNFVFDTAENEPAKNLQEFVKFANFADPNPLTITHRFASAEAVKDVKPNAAGIATTVGALPGTSGGPMASAAVEEQVKLKDLWQEKYTVPMLKSMKTVAFETPSGQHSYNVVMAVYSTQGGWRWVRGRQAGRTSQGSFSAVSTPFLQVNTRSKALDEIVDTLLHRFEPNI